MNTTKVNEIITRYQAEFDHINSEELYKWRAVKCFQDNWNIDTTDFAEMLERSLAKSYNLLSNSNYYPERMLVGIAAKDPRAVRGLFVQLFDEERDLSKRIEEFETGFDALLDKYDPGMNGYQSSRTIMVYLSFRYPDRYFLYKFGMFKDFASLVDYPYKPIRGRIENVLQYLTLSTLLREEVKQHPQLIQLHKNRITPTEYFDASFNILTQDIIYAATNYFLDVKAGPLLSAMERLQKVEKSVDSLPIIPPTFQGRFTNWIENEQENKRIGDLGELLVMEYETAKLQKAGSKKRPVHKSKTEGDGLGYDILSYDARGSEVFIEVKTSKSGLDTPFIVTLSELEKSKACSGAFSLYRLYDFDPKLNAAMCLEIKGSLADFCTYPKTFQVRLR